MVELEERPRFRSDQGIQVSGVPLLILGALGAAGGLAWVLKALLFMGWYIVFLVPMFAAMLLSGVLHLLVGLSHCRNAYLGGAIAILSGVVAYLGFFHLCLLQFLPAGNAHRVDLLPTYIVHRMNTDVDLEVGRIQAINNPKRPLNIANWFRFVFELGIFAGFPGVVAWRRARRAYCPELNQWMIRNIAYFPEHSADGLYQAFETGQLPGFLEKTPQATESQSACRLMLEYAQPSDRSPASYPIYGSIDALPNPKPWYWPKKVRRMYLRQLELQPSEVLTLLPLFPKLARFLEMHHSELAEVTVDVPAVTGPVSVAYANAVITPVPQPYYQQVRGPGYAWQVNLRGAIPLVYFLGGIGLMVLGGHRFLQNEVLPGLALFVVGAAGFGWGLYTSQYCLGAYENRWIRRRLTAEVSRRPDFLVNPSDADAIYVSLIPREHFFKTKMTMATDLLFMRIKPTDGEILLEGDCNRYRIPAGAILACEPQCFFHPMDANQHLQMWMVRLLVRVDGAPRELLLSVGKKGWGPRTNATRKRVAEETCRLIHSLNPGNFAAKDVLPVVL
jgi:hypothetical protein